MSWTILQASLVPSQVYEAKVRSLVVPEDGAVYGGIPSELSLPATWTSHEGSLTPQICQMMTNILIYRVYSDQHHLLFAVFPPAAAWSPNTLIYCFIGIFVATVFYTIYCAVTACRRFVLDSFLMWKFRPFINGFILNEQEGDSVGGLDPVSRQKQDHV